MSLTLSQERYDEIVLGIADRFTDFMEKTMILKRQGSRDVFQRENEGLMMLNVLDALNYYDVDSGIHTDDEIAYLHELATLIIENCPI